MEWSISELIKHPEARWKVQEELDAVVGANRMVEESDIPKLEYLQAIVKETLRLHPVTPMLVPQASREPFSIAGFYIPAKTQIFFKVYAIGRDPSAWKSPLQFDPSRFIGSNFDVRGNHFELLIFGAGRRICPAVNLAMCLLHITLARLFHALHWMRPAGQTAENMDMNEVGFNVGFSKAKLYLRARAGVVSLRRSEIITRTEDGELRMVSNNLIKR
ncbi:hypothetical protein Mapa_004238 [Marchantia paleacea]|nr:hypothetical protein Mapa_004238 [Marchantia paleacea]